MGTPLVHFGFTVIVHRRNGSGDYAACSPCTYFVILCHNGVTQKKRTLANLVNVTIANTQLTKLGETRQHDDRS